MENVDASCDVRKASLFSPITSLAANVSAKAKIISEKSRDLVSARRKLSLTAMSSEDDSPIRPTLSRIQSSPEQNDNVALSRRELMLNELSPYIAQNKRKDSIIIYDDDKEDDNDMEYQDVPPMMRTRSCPIYKQLASVRSSVGRSLDLEYDENSDPTDLRTDKSNDVKELQTLNRSAPTPMRRGSSLNCSGSSMSMQRRATKRAAERNRLLSEHQNETLSTLQEASCGGNNKTTFDCRSGMLNSLLMNEADLLGDSDMRSCDSNSDNTSFLNHHIPGVFGSPLSKRSSASLSTISCDSENATQRFELDRERSLSCSSLFVASPFDDSIRANKRGSLCGDEDLHSDESQKSKRPRSFSILKDTNVSCAVSPLSTSLMRMRSTSFNCFNSTTEKNSERKRSLQDDLCNDEPSSRHQALPTPELKGLQRKGSNLVLSHSVSEISLNERQPFSSTSSEDFAAATWRGPPCELQQNGNGGPCALPTVRARHSSLEDLRMITPRTLVSALNGEFSASFDEVTVVDCRYPYEYDGGHVENAVNVHTRDMLERDFLSKPPASGKRTCIVFHCEFSSKRGPSLYRHMRSVDRAMHVSTYPELFYPELYVLEGGYRRFYGEMKSNCVPQNYILMHDKNFAAELKTALGAKKTENCKRCKSWSDICYDMLLFERFIDVADIITLLPKDDILTDGRTIGSIISGSDKCRGIIRILGHELDRTLLYTYDCLLDGQSHTFIEAYDIVSKTRERLYTRYGLMTCTGCSINREHTLLAFTKSTESSSTDNGSIMYESFLVEIQPQARVFSLSLVSDNYQSVQFLYVDSHRCSFMLLCIHKEIIHLYNIPINHSLNENENAGAFERVPFNSNRIRNDTLLGRRITDQPYIHIYVSRRHLWYQWDMEKQCAYFIYIKPNRKGQTSHLRTMLKCVQFSSKGNSEVIMDISIPLTLHRNLSERSKYLDIPCSPSLPDEHFNMQVVNMAGGGLCLCYQRIVNPRIYSNEAEPIKLTFSIFVLHQCITLEFEVPISMHVPVDEMHTLRIHFATVSSLLLAFVPGVSLHFIDCGTVHAACHHLSLEGASVPRMPRQVDPENDGNDLIFCAPSILTYFQFNSKTLSHHKTLSFDSSSNIIYTISVNCNDLQELFTSSTSILTHVKALHLAICHIQNETLVKNMLIGLTQKAPQCISIELLKEFLIGGSYMKMSDFVKSLLLGFLPITTIPKFEIPGSSKDLHSRGNTLRRLCEASQHACKYSCKYLPDIASGIKGSDSNRRRSSFDSLRRLVNSRSESNHAGRNVGRKGRFSLETLIVSSFSHRATSSKSPLDFSWTVSSQSNSDAAGVVPSPKRSNSTGAFRRLFSRLFTFSPAPSPLSSPLKNSLSDSDVARISAAEMSTSSVDCNDISRSIFINSRAQIVESLGEYLIMAMPKESRTNCFDWANVYVSCIIAQAMQLLSVFSESSVKKITRSRSLFGNPPSAVNSLPVGSPPTLHRSNRLKKSHSTSDHCYSDLFVPVTSPTLSSDFSCVENFQDFHGDLVKTDDNSDSDIERSISDSDIEKCQSPSDNSPNVVLFRLLEEMACALEELHVPVPLSFEAKFIQVGYRCLQRPIFIQYLKCGIFHVNENFVTSVIQDLDLKVRLQNAANSPRCRQQREDDEDFKFLLLSRLPETVAIRLLRSFETHPESVRYMSRYYAKDIVANRTSGNTNRRLSDWEPASSGNNLAHAYDDGNGSVGSSGHDNDLGASGHFDMLLESDLSVLERSFNSTHHECTAKAFLPLNAFMHHLSVQCTHNSSRTHQDAATDSNNKSIAVGNTNPSLNLRRRDMIAEATLKAVEFPANELNFIYDSHSCFLRLGM